MDRTVLVVDVGDGGDAGAVFCPGGCLHHASPQ